MTEHVVGARIPDLRTILVHVSLRYVMKRRGTGGVTPEGLRRAAARFERGNGRWKLPPFVTIEPASVGPLEGEWVSVSAAAGGDRRSDAVVLYFHGGGFAMGSPATHRPVTWRVARAARRRVLAVGYRKAPDHAFPAWVDDGIGAYRWLLGQGFAPGDVILSGDSAGGNLALAVAHRARREGLPPPGALILFSPWGDLACAAPSYRKNARSEAMFRAREVRELGALLIAAHDPRDPELSPVHADLAGFPPMLVFAGSGELFVDDARTLAKNAAAAGARVDLYVYRHMPHAFPVMAGLLPRAKPAFETIARFVDALPAAAPRAEARAG